MIDPIRWGRRPACAILLSLLVACGGGGSGPVAGSTGSTVTTAGGGGSTAPSVPLSLSADATSATEGGPPVRLRLSGGEAADFPVSWSLPGGLGSLSDAADSGVTYTPPALGVASVGAATATITATSRTGATLSIELSITLQPFAIASVSPAEADSARIDATPTLRFTRAVAPTSVTPEAVRVASPIAAVGGALSEQDSALVFTPSAPLAWGTRYRIDVAGSVASVAGQLLAPAQAEFTTAAARWQPATTLQALANAGSPELGVDAQGNALAVWVQSVSGSVNLRSARYDAQTQTWGAATTLAEGVFNPRLAVNAAGVAIVVWNKSGPFGLQMHFATYDAAAARWSAPSTVPTGGLWPQAGEVALDAAGNAIVAWSDLSEARGVRAIRLRADTRTWSSTLVLQTAASGTPDQRPKLAVDAAGNAIVAWSQTANAGNWAVYAAHYDVSANSWSTAEALQQSTSNGTPQSLAINRQGDAVLVWGESRPDSSYSLLGSRYHSATKRWDAAREIQAYASDTHMTGAAHAVVDAAGNATAVWAAGNDPGSRLVSARYAALEGRWQPAREIESMAESRFVSMYAVARLALDGAGNVFALWHRTDPAASNARAVLSARYSASNDRWDAPQALHGSGQSAVETANLAMTGSGDALAIWLQHPGSFNYELVTRRLTGP